MAAPRLSPELAWQALDALREHGNQVAAARALNMPLPTYQTRLRRAYELGLDKPEAERPRHGFQIVREAATYGPDGELRSASTVTAPERAPAELPPSFTVKGISQLRDANGNVIQEWVKAREERGLGDLIAGLRETFDKYRGRAKPVPAPAVTDSSLLTMYPIPDLHFGMMAWGRETGENYDLKVAAKRARESLGTLVSQSRPSRQAIVLGLGDYFHQNDQTNETPRGRHRLDVDGRWPKVLSAGARLAVEMVELVAQKHESVLVRFLPGNHDPDAAVALTVALSLFFEDDPRVTVDDTPGLFFYHRFGTNLIGGHHGHGITHDRMAMAMASDCAEDWGSTTYRHMVSGHVHHERSKEVMGVLVESMGALTARDAYSQGAGFRSKSSLVAVTYHDTRGEIGRHRVNIQPPRLVA